MKTRIVSVGCQLPTGPIEQFNFSFRPKLELEDILIISPRQTPVAYGYQFGTYHGKPCLNEALSEQILADKEFWEDCILKRLMAGKNVYVLLEKPEQYYIHTGDVRRIKNGSRHESFSLVTLFHTYSVLPAEVGRPLAANDITSQSEITDPMLRLVGENFASDFIPRAYFPPEEFGGKSGIIHPVSKAVIGGTVEVSNGRIILLPTLDLEKPEFLGSREGKEYWSEHAKTFIQRFAHTILEIEKRFVPVENKKEAVVLTRFDLPEDATLSALEREKILLSPQTGRIESQIQELTLKLEELKKEQELANRQAEAKAREEQEPNKLLFESGAELEKIVLKILNRFHLDPSDSREANIENPFEADDARWIFSVFATDAEAVSHDALSSLIHKSQEEFSKEESGQFPKAVLIANAFRDIDPLSRGEFFTAKCIRLAAHHRIALVRAMDLIAPFKYLRNNPKDIRFAALCREAIQNAEGKIVRFPAPPQQRAHGLRDAQRKSALLTTTFGHGKIW